MTRRDRIDTVTLVAGWALAIGIAAMRLGGWL